MKDMLSMLQGMDLQGMDMNQLDALESGTSMDAISIAHNLDPEELTFELAQIVFNLIYGYDNIELIDFPNKIKATIKDEEYIFDVKFEDGPDVELMQRIKVITDHMGPILDQVHVSICLNVLFTAIETKLIKLL